MGKYLDDLNLDFKGGDISSGLDGNINPQTGDTIIFGGRPVQTQNYLLIIGAVIVIVALIKNRR